MQSTEESVQIQAEHILHSDTFRNADSLRRLLKFLADKLANGEADHLKEYTIGVDALGKPPTYDPRGDATVRIQVGRLRQKLADYYQTEGKDDPWIISLPKGRLRLLCEPRAIAETNPEHTAPLVKAPQPWWSQRVVVGGLALGCILFLAWALAGNMANRRLEQRTHLFEAMWTPELNELWQPFISGTNKPLIVSIADPPFAQFEGAGSYRELSLNTWEDIQASPNIKKIRAALGSPNLVPGGYYSPIGEVSASFALGKLLGPRVSAMSLLRTSQISLQQLADNNVLYIGASVFFYPMLRNCPAKLEFLPSVSSSGATSGISVVEPKSGEPTKYNDQLPTGPAENGDMYALVTHVPGPRRTSEITAFMANRTSARLAAVEWFTEPQYAKVLASKLRQPDGSLPHYYQVVLKVKFMSGVPTETSYVTHRGLTVAAPADGGVPSPKR